MRKVSVLIATLIAAMVSTSADAAMKKGHHRHHVAAAVTVGNTGGAPYMDATEAQRARFFHDTLFPWEAK